MYPGLPHATDGYRAAPADPGSRNAEGAEGSHPANPPVRAADGGWSVPEGHPSGIRPGKPGRGRCGNGTVRCTPWNDRVTTGNPFTDR